MADDKLTLPGAGSILATQKINGKHYIDTTLSSISGSVATPISTTNPIPTTGNTVVTATTPLPITLDAFSITSVAPLPVVASTDTLLDINDYLVEVQRGNVTGASMVHKFGRNISVSNGSWEFINLLGFTAWPLSAATTVRIKANGSGGNDTAAGSGAREVTVQGIDDSLNEVTETITTNGILASTATTALFWRVHRAWVSSAGTYGSANAANMTIENSGGGTNLILIAAGEGQTQFAGWTVPIGKSAYLLSVTITVDSNKSANVRVMTRANINDTTAPMASKRLKLYFDGVVGHLSYKPRGPELMIPALSDIWVEGWGDGAVSQISADFELLVIDD